MYNVYLLFINIYYVELYIIIEAYIRNRGAHFIIIFPLNSHSLLKNMRPLRDLFSALEKLKNSLPQNRSIEPSGRNVYIYKLYIPYMHVYVLCLWPVGTCTTHYLYTRTQSWLKSSYHVINKIASIYPHFHYAMPIIIIKFVIEFMSMLLSFHKISIYNRSNIDRCMSLFAISAPFHENQCPCLYDKHDNNNHNDKDDWIPSHMTGLKWDLH